MDLEDLLSTHPLAKVNNVKIFSNSPRFSQDQITAKIASGTQRDLEDVAYAEQSLTISEMEEICGKFTTSDRGLSERPDLPLHLLLDLLKSSDEAIRVEALNNPNAPFDVVYDAIMENKYSLKKSGFAINSSCIELTKNRHIANSFEMFEKLWEKKILRVWLIRGLNKPTRRSYSIDQSITEFLRNTIKEQSNVVRFEYAASVFFADPVTLDILKDDPHRPVVTRIAYNDRAYPSTHEYLLDNYTNSMIKDGIARMSTDNTVLNRVYNSTKSKEIRRLVEDNPDFMRL